MLNFGVTGSSGSHSIQRGTVVSFGRLAFFDLCLVPSGLLTLRQAVSVLLCNKVVSLRATLADKDASNASFLLVQRFWLNVDP